MNLHKIIKEEYTSILRENLEYKNIDFNQINDTPQGIAELLNNHILSNLIGLSNLLLKIPKEKTYNLTSIKEMIQFINNIKEDIDELNELSEKFEEFEEYDELDKILYKVNNIYDEINTLFDQLDSILIDIDDKFDDFSININKYIK